MATCHVQVTARMEANVCNLRNCKATLHFQEGRRKQIEMSTDCYFTFNTFFMEAFQRTLENYPQYVPRQHVDLLTSLQPISGSTVAFRTAISYLYIADSQHKPNQQRLIYTKNVPCNRTRLFIVYLEGRELRGEEKTMCPSCSPSESPPE